MESIRNLWHLIDGIIDSFATIFPEIYTFRDKQNKPSFSAGVALHKIFMPMQCQCPPLNHQGIYNLDICPLNLFHQALQSQNSFIRKKQFLHSYLHLPTTWETQTDHHGILNYEHEDRIAIDVVIVLQEGAARFVRWALHTLSLRFVR